MLHGHGVQYLGSAGSATLRRRVSRHQINDHVGGCHAGRDEVFRPGEVKRFHCRTARISGYRYRSFGLIQDGFVEDGLVRGTELAAYSLWLIG